MKKISRRSFLAAAGVSAAALALTACGGSSNSTAASTATSAVCRRMAGIIRDIGRAGHRTVNVVQSLRLA